MAAVWRALVACAPLLAAPAAATCSQDASGGACSRDAGLALLHLNKGVLSKAQVPTDEVAESTAVDGIVEARKAAFPANSELKLYAVGSSNLVYEVWYDMLHGMLRKLGYRVAQQSFELARTQRPKRAPACDDEADYVDLRTPRLGKPGWASWGFAYDNNSDCQGQDHGFRRIEGYFVKCLNGWACWREVDNPPEILYKPSAIAQEAKDADIVFLSHWINDSKQWMTSYSCYGAAVIDQIDTVVISANSTRLLIRAIRKVNPKAYIVIVARYPEQHRTKVNNGTVEGIIEINAAMREYFKDEPRTVFADFRLPIGEVVFQSRKQMAGHPNCRGDRVIATSVAEALFRAGVLARGLALGGGECLARKDCARLRVDCCQRAALCRWAKNSTCVPYGPGVGLVKNRDR